MWTPEAEKTFDAIIEYLEARWTEKEIQNFIHNTQKVISQIKSNPYSFQSSTRKEIRRAIISKHNSLFYNINVKENVIELYTFWDNRKDPEKRLY